MKTLICQRCESEWADYAADCNDFSRIAEADPACDPRHRDATDAEWWAWLLGTSGGGQ
jgi:hypothetical protein